MFRPFELAQHLNARCNGRKCESPYITVIDKDVIYQTNYLSNFMFQLTVPQLYIFCMLLGLLTKKLQLTVHLKYQT